MVPAEHRPSGIERYFDAQRGVGPIERAWLDDEFVLDPTRVTLHVGRTGMDGVTFKKLLMDRYDIHINKTSRNTVLFLIHIGMTRGAIAQLLKSLRQIATELERTAIHSSDAEEAAFAEQVESLTAHLPPLPNFSRFHPAFQPDPGSTTPEGDIRRAFYQSYDVSACRFVKLDPSLRRAVATGTELVSASFVTPYPPGFPVLVPGQLVSSSILAYLKALDVKEIHGYRAGRGLRVFKAEVLDARRNARAPSPGGAGGAAPRTPSHTQEVHS
jgi:arginine decarboxylase